MYTADANIVGRAVEGELLDKSSEGEGVHRSRSSSWATRKLSWPFTQLGQKGQEQKNLKVTL